MPRFLVVGFRFAAPSPRCCSETSQPKEQRNWELFLQTRPTARQKADHVLLLNAEHGDTIVASGFNTNITVYDLQCVRDGEELRDGVLNFYVQSKIQHSKCEESAEAHFPNDVAFSTLFYQQLHHRRHLPSLARFERAGLDGGNCGQNSKPMRDEGDGPKNCRPVWDGPAMVLPVP